MQRLHKNGWATAMLRLPEEKEEIHMPFPFDVGNKIFQEALLDWVAQPPPAQVRDTHALRFRLLRLGAGGETRNPQFTGLMFFRPQQLGAGPVGSTPGLDGFGSLLVTEGVCESLLDPNHRCATSRVGSRLRRVQTATVGSCSRICHINIHGW